MLKKFLPIVIGALTPIIIAIFSIKAFIIFQLVMFSIIISLVILLNAHKIIPWGISSGEAKDILTLECNRLIPILKNDLELNDIKYELIIKKKPSILFSAVNDCLLFGLFGGSDNIISLQSEPSLTFFYENMRTYSFGSRKRFKKIVINTICHELKHIRQYKENPDMFKNSHLITEQKRNELEKDATQFAKIKTKMYLKGITI